jgi:hypothetical protein
MGKQGRHDLLRLLDARQAGQRAGAPRRAGVA